MLFLCGLSGEKKTQKRHVFASNILKLGIASLAGERSLAMTCSEVINSKFVLLSHVVARRVLVLSDEAISCR
jgi:hypothetical protein